MGFRPEPSTESLQRSLKLNRKLLSLIQKSGSEAEVAQFVVNMLHEEFPGFRISYSLLRLDSTFRIFCSCQPPGLPDLTGLVIKFSDDTFAANIRNMQVGVIDDIRLHPSTAKIAAHMLNEVGTVARIDYPFERKDNGEVGLITLSHQSAQKWSPEIVQLLSEITELVHLIFREARTRERLRESEILLQQFAENLPFVFWVVEPVEGVPNQRVIYVSPAYEKVWGLSVESVMADPFTFLRAIHPEDQARIREGVMSRRLGPYEQLYRVVRPDGSVRHVRDRGHPLLDENGRIYRILGIAEDITPLYEARVKLENTQAQVLSNAKFAALGEMAGGIAHEIANPLAIINALAQQMREQGSRGELTEALIEKNLETVERMSVCIATIVKGLRTFSRQADHDPLLPADLGCILRETLILCEAKIQQAGAKLMVSFPEKDIQLKCRSSEISQIVLNLVNNALDAVSHSSEKLVFVKAEVTERQVLLTVEDSGHGVKEENRELIFQPFFTTKEVGKGTGLGLSISRGIAEAHGGKLYLEPSSAKTRFVVQLPLEAM